MLGRLACARSRTNVEADDDGVGSGRQGNVGLGHAADGGVDDVDLDLGLVHLVERITQSLDRALNVGLDHEVELRGAFLDAAEQVVQAHMGLGLLGLQALAQRTLLGELAGIALVLEHAELVACGRNA